MGFPTLSAPRCDLLFEDEGSVWRVQCKTGHVVRGAVYFATESRRSVLRGTEWRRVAANYEGQIDFFGVDRPDNGVVYLVPIADTETNWRCGLRIDPPKNNQKKTDPLGPETTASTERSGL